MNYRIGVIGGGNMGGGMVMGMARAIGGGAITVFEHHREKAEALQNAVGCHIARSEEEAVRGMTHILLAVKPYAILPLLERLLPVLEEGQRILSVAAGITLKQMEEAVGRAGKKIPVIRLMPNTSVSIGEGVVLTALPEDDGTLKEELDGLFASCGLIEYGTEAELEAAMAISGSSPAFLYVMIEAMADAGVEIGLKREKSLRLAAATVAGAGKLALQTGKHPGILKDEVCSPGGCTIVGIAELENSGFRGAVARAVKAVDQKGRSLKK